MDNSKPQIANDIMQKESKIAGFIFPFVCFLSAFLMFNLEPLFAKLLTPLMGGSPMVWNTALVFYQSTLLIGYLYAFLINKYFSIKFQIIIHSILLVLGLFFQPIHISSIIGPPNIEKPILWTFMALLMSIGIPIIGISATAPLIGAWYARFKNGINPYYLYAASNFGSFIALGLFPFVTEPLFGAKTISLFWLCGFILFTLTIIYSGLLVKNTYPLNTKKHAIKIENKTRFKWIFYSAIPSALLISITNHIVTDIASVPLLWLPPLALFLLTFVIAYSNYGAKIQEGAWFLKLLIVFLICFLAAINGDKGLIGLLIHLLCFFLIVLAINLELASIAPIKENLTEYYLFLSIGGVLGGVFAALIAPQIFNITIEYPLLIALSLLIGGEKITFQRNTLFAIFIIFAISMWFSNRSDIAIFLSDKFDKFQNVNFHDLMLVWEDETAAGFMVAFLFIIAIFSRNTKIIVFIAGLLAAILPMIYDYSSSNVIYRGRNFFGLIELEETGKAPDGWRFLSNGTTLHGVMSLDKEKNKIAMSYYWHETPIGLLFDEISQQKPNNLVAGVIGLGMGSTACYGNPQQDWTFFEINPLVVKLALDKEKIGFIPNCVPNAKIILGDARISIQNQENAKFDILLLDAFTSDSIPTHLITQEAIKLLMSKVKKDGILIVHISNRYLELSNIVADGALKNDFSVMKGQRNGNKNNPHADTGVSAMIIAHNEARFSNYYGQIWKHYGMKTNPKPWTDDHTDILRAILKN